MTSCVEVCGSPGLSTSQKVRWQRCVEGIRLGRCDGEEDELKILLLLAKNPQETIRQKEDFEGRRKLEEPLTLFPKQRSGAT